MSAHPEGEPTPWITEEAAAARALCSTRRIRRAWTTGELRYVGSHPRLTRAEWVDDWLREQAEHDRGGG
jgi:hypothetical protein